MRNGTVEITLRPIKFAFLVDRTDRKAILEAIEINTYLWGGIYNPIIPIYKKRSLKWGSFSGKNFKDIVNGYIDTFDPDIIVNVGNVINENLKFGARKIITSDDILGRNPENTLIPQFGLGIHEVMIQFIKDELRFVRKHPYTLISLDYSGSCSLFLKSVFGSLSENISKKFNEYYFEFYPFETSKCTIDNFGTYFNNKFQFLRRITEKYIKYANTRSSLINDCVYVLDAKNSLDILDYWNLRAIGWKVLPYPIQATKNELLLKYIERYIEENSYPIQNNPQIFNDTKILKSRSINDEIFKQTIGCLDIKQPKDTRKYKYATQYYYPRMWDDWAREKDFVEYCDIGSDNKTVDISNSEDLIAFDSVAPEFSKNYFKNGPQYANEVEFSILGDGDILYAKVIPEGNQNLIYLFGAYGSNEWRFSRNGIVFLSKHNKQRVGVRLPAAETVFLRWLENKNFKPVISDNGRIVTQMIKYIGGIWELSYLAKEPIVKLLIELKDGKTKTENQIFQILSPLFDKDKGNIKRKEVVENLSKLKIIRSGVEIKCPICTQMSWFSLKELDYHINCPKCINDFQFNLSSQNEIKPSFKSIGPFSFSEKNYGAISELFALRFFSSVLHHSATIITGFKLKNDVEIDLGVILQSSFGGNKKTKTLFVECKTYNEFMEKDIKRVKYLVNLFPGCVFVFATLKNKLSKKEIKLITQLAKKAKKNKIMGKPYNSILILTGIELFAENGPPYCWLDLGGKHEYYCNSNIDFYDLEELCVASQDIYLGVDPIHENYIFSTKKGAVKPVFNP